MGYTTFLLDLDHTLFDSDTSEDAAFAGTLAAAGIEQPDEYRATYRRINLALWAAVERGEIAAREVRTRRFEHFVEECGFDADPLQMADDFVAGLAANGELYDGVHDILAGLVSSGPLALITNGLSEVQRARIERTGIGDYFEAIVISAEVGVAKPAAGIFDIAFEALDSPAAETTLMVGDNLSSDIRGGRNYGVGTCWYNPGGREGNDRDRPDHVIGELRELLGFVGL